MLGIKPLLSIIKGKAVVITQKDGNKADVVIGKSLTKQFVVSSLAGAVKALML